MNNQDLHLAKLCAIAYADDALKQYHGLNYRAAALHQKWATDEAYILSNGVQLCVVARGSEDWEDWALRNAIAIPAFIPALGIKAHWGLWEAAQSVLPAIEAAIVCTRPEQIIFTGHSKGGAMALLWAIALQQYKPQVCTFGCPRVVTNGAVRVHHRRVIHIRDPVGRLGPRVAGWQHQGFPIVIGDHGAILSPQAMEAEMAEPFDIRTMPDRIASHFAYGPDIRALRSPDPKT
jgi:hypothetical protein